MRKLVPSHEVILLNSVAYIFIFQNKLQCDLIVKKTGVTKK